MVFFRLLLSIVAMAEPSSFTYSLTEAQIQSLKQVLQAKGYTFREVPYAHFGASKNKLQITAYQSGKCTLQGKDSREFIEFVLEPEILQEASLGYEKVLKPELFAAHIGVDESGKGDFFGPLVTAGVYAPSEAIEEWMRSGVKDSKTVTSAKKMAELAELIRETRGVRVELIQMNNPKYNELQKKMGSVNEVLGWCHARVIQNLVEATGCPKVMTDKFAKTDWTVKKYLRGFQAPLDLTQRHKAESDPVVAAASIVARHAFNEAMAGLAKKLGCRVPHGASAQVKQAAKEILEKHGRDTLASVTKTHFRTWAQVTGEGQLFSGENADEDAS